MVTEATGPVLVQGETCEGMIMVQDREGHGGRLDTRQKFSLPALLIQVPDGLFAPQFSFAPLEQHSHLRFWKGV